MHRIFDVVAITHNHRDHVDVASMKKLLPFQPKLLVPLGDERFFRNLGFTDVQEVVWNEKVDLGDGVSIDAVPARHWSGRSGTDAHKSLFNGYVVQSEAVEGDIYFAGDTALMYDKTRYDQQEGSEAKTDITVLCDKYNIRYSFQPGGPDEVRSDMEPTHQCSADALLMHVMFSLKAEKPIQTIFMHTQAFKLGNLHFDDTRSSVTRILNLLKYMHDNYQATAALPYNKLGYYKALTKDEKRVFDLIFKIYFPHYDGYTSSFDSSLSGVKKSDLLKLYENLAYFVCLPKIGANTVLQGQPHGFGHKPIDAAVNLRARREFKAVSPTGNLNEMLMAYRKPWSLFSNRHHRAAMQGNLNYLIPDSINPEGHMATLLAVDLERKSPRS